MRDSGMMREDRGRCASVPAYRSAAVGSGLRCRCVSVARDGWFPLGPCELSAGPQSAAPHRIRPAWRGWRCCRHAAPPHPLRNPPHLHGGAPTPVGCLAPTPAPAHAALPLPLPPSRPDPLESVAGSRYGPQSGERLGAAGGTEEGKGQREGGKGEGRRAGGGLRQGNHRGRASGGRVDCDITGNGFGVHARASHATNICG